MAGLDLSWKNLQVRALPIKTKQHRQTKTQQAENITTKAEEELSW